MKIAITTHVFTTGPGQDFRDYLISQKTEKLLFIGQPLFFASHIVGPSYYLYTKGKLTKQVVTPNLNIPLIIKYVRCFMLTLFWGVKFINDYDLFVGCNDLNAFVGLILKKLGRVKKCVYYVIDYNPKRFDNIVLNHLYHWLDHVCVKYCDETWNLSPRMEEGRKKFFNVSSRTQKLVPIGIWYKRIRVPPFARIKRNSAVFAGHLIEKQGIQNILQAIPEIIKVKPDFIFEIFGDGEFKPTLEALTIRLNIQEHVKFHGYIQDHTDLEEKISKGAFAFALYDKYDAKGNFTFTYFADPGKIKLFLACGLPVLLTDVSYNAHDLVAAKCGLLIGRGRKSISSTAIKLLKDPTLLKMYKKNARDYAKRFDWPIIFESLSR